MKEGKRQPLIWAGPILKVIFPIPKTHIENPIIELITLLTMSDTSFINDGLSLSRLEQSMLQFLFQMIF